MIRLVDEPPQEAVLGQLRDWQAEVDGVVEFRERVAAAKRLFKQQNRADNPTFASVRAALRAMCGDAEWCCYCERSQAAEIDHIRPKSLFPSAVFSWANFLWVCGRCNKLKSNRYSIVEGAQLRRLPCTVDSEPTGAAPALIDPRREDPLAFLWLDLFTFELLPARGLPKLSLERAAYTIETLDLNADALAAQRHRAYYCFANELLAYTHARERRVSELELSGFSARVRRDPHKVVWESMKRRPAELEPRVAALFEAAPEALQW